MTSTPIAPERAWAQQAKREAAAQHPNDPVEAQWAYRHMVIERAKERAAKARSPSAS